ncbi:aminodeoxychorismate lyase [Botrytis cinerea]
MSPSPPPNSTPTFQLFTSLRYDPLLLQSPKNIESWPLPTPSPSPFYMLPYHRDRLLQAASHFSFHPAITAISGASGFQNLLSVLSNSIDTQSPTPLRVRIVLDHEGTITIESNPVPPVPLSNLFPTRLPPPTSIPTPAPTISPLTGGALTLGPTTTLPSDPTQSSPGPSSRTPPPPPPRPTPPSKPPRAPPTTPRVRAPKSPPSPPPKKSSSSLPTTQKSWKVPSQPPSSTAMGNGLRRLRRAEARLELPDDGH